MYDFPLSQKDVEMRDSVYIISLWRSDSTIKYKNSRLLRKDCENQVHDIIKFHEAIESESSKSLMQHLQYLNSIDFDRGLDANGNEWVQPVWLEIMSPGGSVASGIEMRSIVESSRRPVIPIISGLCASAATFMFTANQNHRLMQAASILLIHQMSQGTGWGQTMKQVEWETETRNMAVWQSQIEQFYYGLKRPTSYTVKKFGPMSDTEKSDWDGAVRPYTESSTPEEMTTGRVKSLVEYRDKVKDLMKGIDCYMPSLEALQYGFCTGIFTSWEDEEKRHDSPAYYKPGSLERDQAPAAEEAQQAPAAQPAAADQGGENEIIGYMIQGL